MSNGTNYKVERVTVAEGETTSSVADMTGHCVVGFQNVDMAGIPAATDVSFNCYPVELLGRHAIPAEDVGGAVHNIGEDTAYSQGIDVATPGLHPIDPRLMPTGGRVQIVLSQAATADVDIFIIGKPL